MKLFTLSISLFISCLSYGQQDNLSLWYTKPAEKWTDALPVGNGRLGGMVFGGIQQERIQLNEESVWAGAPINNNNPGAKAHLKEIQTAIFNGDYKTANELSKKYLVGTPPNVRSYQTLGDLGIKFYWKSAATNYKRSLNIQTGIAKTEYTVDGNKIVQEVFVSAPQNLMVITIQAEKPFDADFLLSREFNADYETGGNKKRKTDGISKGENHYQVQNGLAYYNGQIIDLASDMKGPGGKHMRYTAAMKILSQSGVQSPIVSDSSAGFKMVGSKSIVLILTGATDYNLDKLDMNPSIDPLTICKQILTKASSYSAALLKQIHVKDHESFFNRVSFSLKDDNNSQYPTDQRLVHVREGKNDNGLVALYYQYGRYLLMGSSRKPGKLPANLQGIWNDLYDAPWSADFHTNINLQMNYWPAETGNLSETSEVLAKFMEKIMVPGAVTAAETYGAKGWTLHHLTDPFGRTGVMDGVWGITNMDGPWMTLPVFDHFEFTNDTNYLRTIAYPMMKGSVEFVLDFLVPSPEGYLVTNPSHSPENSFFVPNTNRKQKSQMTYAPTVDMHIINALFNNFTRASSILNVDKSLADKVMAAQKKLPPMKISALGTIQEWIEDFEETELGHRHISHLLGLYPLDLISPKNPAIFEAAKKTLERRLSNGGGHTGWSKAWIVSLYARLFEPEKALENLNGLFKKSTLNNLFDTHPPFQIDGNFGAAAAIAEMIMQSQNNEINLLPALPKAWSEGSMHGLRARGACTVNIDWTNGELKKATIQSSKGGTYTIRYKELTKTVSLKPNQTITIYNRLN
jgi:alpha-L-fucosidase 2